VGDDVRYRQIDGFGVVLDLAAQRYSVMDELATSAWAILTGEAEAGPHIQQWTQEYEVTADEIRSAIDEFGANCLRLGWLRPRQLSANRYGDPRISRLAGWGRRLPGGLVAVWALIFSALSLKFKGLRKTYGRHGEVVRISEVDKPPAVEKATRDFLFAENFIFFRSGANDCLVRSLALFRYLCWVGIPATHIIGVRRAPFAAHAWVEIAGKGVLAPAPRGYSILAMLTPICR
jgi:hypothetical protein